MPITVPVNNSPSLAPSPYKGFDQRGRAMDDESMVVPYKQDKNMSDATCRVPRPLMRANHIKLVCAKPLPEEEKRLNLNIAIL